MLLFKLEPGVPEGMLLRNGLYMNPSCDGHLLDDSDYRTSNPK
jgi:hypothetical protein